jgi:toxin ParE1/3/4
VTRIEFAPEVVQDFDRFVDHMLRYEVESPVERIKEIVQSIEVLRLSPQIGRPVRHGKRELVIGRGSRGYVALYRYVEDLDTAFVLAIRSQRERSFKHPTGGS